jgi:hypothetical protein
MLVHCSCGGALHFEILLCSSGVANGEIIIINLLHNISPNENLETNQVLVGESYCLLDLACCDFTHDCVTGSNGRKNDAHLTEVELRFG